MSQTAVGNLAVILSANASGMAAGFKDAEGQVSAFGTRMNRQAGQFGRVGDAIGGQMGTGLSGAFGRVGGAGVSAVLMRFGGYAAVAGAALKAGETVGETFRMGIQAAADREQAAVSFGLLLGDDKEAERVMGRIEAGAQKAGMAVGDLSVQVRRLMGSAGMGPDEAQKLALSVRNISIATGGDYGGMMKGVTDAIGKGRLEAEEVRGQLAEHGFPIQELAETMGVSMVRLQEKMKDGKVGVDVLLKTIERLGGAGGKWGQAGAKEADTFTGRLAALGATADRVAGKLVTVTGTFASLKGMMLLGEKGMSATGRLLDGWTWGPAVAGAGADRPGAGVSLAKANPFRDKAAAEAGRAAVAARLAAPGAKDGGGSIAGLVGQLGGLEQAVRGAAKAWDGFTDHPREQIDQLKKEIGKLSFGPASGSPMDAYEHSMGQLAAAQRQFGPLMSMMTGRGAERYRLNEFAKLEQSLGMGGGGEARLAPALTRGSQAAESAISKALASTAGRGDREAQVKAVIEAGNRQRQRMIEMERDTLNALNKLSQPKVVNF